MREAKVLERGPQDGLIQHVAEDRTKYGPYLVRSVTLASGEQRWMLVEEALLSEMLKQGLLTSP